MKANEAPEKIYIQPNAHDGWFESNPHSNIFVEYTRSDVFVEKACKGIEKLLSGYIIRNFHFGDSYDVDRLIEDFEEYLKK